VILPGTYVRQGDCLIGKVKKILRTREVIDASVYVGVGDSGIVERVLKTTSAESRKIVMVKIREVRKPRAGDKCACYSFNTDILTKNRGWISIKDVTLEDQVASLDNGKLVYVHPEATQEYDYEGDMYSLTSNQVDLFVTPNHNLYVKKRYSNDHELVRADKVFGKRVNHKKNAKNDKIDQEYFILPGCTYIYRGVTIVAQDKQIPMNSWLKLFGIWIAEGCANPKHVKICGHKKRVRDVLDEIESDLGIQFSKTRDMKYDETLQSVYYILDRQFCSYFSEWSLGAVNKKLPSWCFELSETQSRILLDSMILGDGHISKNNCVKYYTSSKQLSDDVQILSLHAGYSANIKKRYEAGHSVWYETRQEYITSTADSYDITIVKTKNEPQINHGHCRSQNGQKEEWVPYNGKVYCCTVPSGVIYIRHNNKPVWCGNSRYAQKGTIGIVMPSENMPVVMTGPNAGMSPDLIINPHCFTGDSQVGLFNGLSRKISSFSPEGCEMVWTIGDKGMVSRHSLGMTERGVKDIVQVTLLDGRKIRCTPDHKFVTISNGERVMVEARDLSGKEVVMGIECVEDIKGQDETNWELVTKDYTFKMDTELNREKTLAFARILGYILTDGTLCKVKDTNYIRSPISLGCQMDVDMIMRDIYLITRKTPKYRYEGGVFVFNIPGCLANSIGSLDDITIERRTTQEAKWPSFVLKDDCPKSFLREFIGGLFGGDGHSPSLLRGKLVPIHFSKSVCVEYIESLKTKMTQLCDMMIKVGVYAKISRLRKTHSKSESYKTHPRLTCEIVIPNLLDFGEKIGFRYCSQKMSKLSAAIGYVRLQDNVRKQMEFVNTRTSDLFDTSVEKVLLKDCLEKARNELKEKECVLNEYYSLSNIQTLGNRRKASRSLTLKSFDYSHFPTFDKYLEQIGCLDWFKPHSYVNTQKNDFVSSYHMKVLDVRPCGVEKVFDIGVSEFHFFTVSGVCVSNCTPSRMTVGKMVEIMTSKVSAMTGKKVNATAFRKFDLDGYSDELVKLGFDRYGSESMFNGMTGEMFENPIFMGPCYYQALKHHVQDKIQQRGRGPVKITTRQPTAGRTKGGGRLLPQWTVKCLLVRIQKKTGKIFKFRENPNIAFFTKPKLETLWWLWGKLKGRVIRRRMIYE
jgi:intein/homing endonuclease